MKRSLVPSWCVSVPASPLPGPGAAGALAARRRGGVAGRGVRRLVAVLAALVAVFGGARVAHARCGGSWSYCQFNEVPDVDVSGVDNALRYRVSYHTDLNRSTRLEYWPEGGSRITTSCDGHRFDHEIEIWNLPPDTLIHYQICDCDGSTPSMERTFRSGTLGSVYLWTPSYSASSPTPYTRPVSLSTIALAGTYTACPAGGPYDNCYDSSFAQVLFDAGEHVIAADRHTGGVVWYEPLRAQNLDWTGTTLVYGAGAELGEIDMGGNPVVTPMNVSARENHHEVRKWNGTYYWLSSSNYATASGNTYQAAEVRSYLGTASSNLHASVGDIITGLGYAVTDIGRQSVGTGGTIDWDHTNSFFIYDGPNPAWQGGMLLSNRQLDWEGTTDTDGRSGTVVFVDSAGTPQFCLGSGADTGHCGSHGIGYTLDAGSTTGGWFDEQHHAQFISYVPPRVMVYDNYGYKTGGRDYTRVVVMQLDTTNKIARMTTEVPVVGTGGSTDHQTCRNGGSAHYLSTSGHYLVSCQGDSSSTSCGSQDDYVYEYDASNRLVWALRIPCGDVYRARPITLPAP